MNKMLRQLQRRSHGSPAVLLTLTLLVLFLAPVFTASAQEKTITGTVTGPDNKGIPGVSIYQKGTSSGTISNADGEYSLVLASGDGILIFSVIGYTSQEIPLTGQAVINVSLKEDTKTLDEVIVVGYGEQKRSDLTGAVAVVKVADTQNKTQFRLDNALQGMVSGINVTRSGGAPGQAPTVHIRGVGSVNGTDPLWIIDGVRMDPGNNFDINDAESIEVLKDAASCAIYGVQGANGVILVRTKRGKGDFKVDFRTSLGQRQPFNFPQFLNSADFVTYKKQSRINAGQNPDPSWDNYSSNTNWLKAFYAGSGLINSNYLSISKGDDKLSYFMSLGNDNEQGILVDNSFKRYSLRMNTDMKVVKWLTIGENMLLSRTVENPIGNNDENYNGGIPYRSIPTMPIYDPSNPYGGWGKGPAYFGGPNAVATQYQQHETRNSNRLDGNLYVDLHPISGLSIRSTLGLNYYSYLSQAFNEAFDYGTLANHTAQLYYSSNNSSRYLANAVATYSRSISKHNFKLMAGYEAWASDARHFNVVGYGFPVNNAAAISLTTGTITSTDRQNVDQVRALSQFSRFNYSYDERYLLEANIRRDGSSLFGPERRFGVFPSVSVGWNVSREKFFADVPFITNLKVRASKGRLGSNNGVAPNSYKRVYTNQFSTYAFDESGTKVPGFYLARFPNEDVHWEQADMSNIAIDLTALDNKFSFSIDYYIKNTRDLLLAVNLPPSVGISTNNFDTNPPAVNVGRMRNVGIDIDLGYKTTYQKFTIGATANASFVKNKMLSTPDNQPIFAGSAGLQIGGMTRTSPGDPVSSFYGYRVQQILNSKSDVDAINTYPKAGFYQEAGTGPGDLMYRDLNGVKGKPDGQITPQYDRTVIGNPWPKMTYALNINSSYNKVVDLSIQFQGVYGVDIFNANKAYTRNFFGDDNTTVLIKEAWTPEHHTNNPRNISGDPNGNWAKPSSYFIESGSYLKIRNIQIGFNVPKDWLGRVKLSNVRLYVNGNNLFTLTKYSGVDPEVAGSNVARGVDFGTYPQVKTYSGGLQVSF